jgi:hypothetical protein
MTIAQALRRNLTQHAATSAVAVGQTAAVNFNKRASTIPRTPCPLDQFMVVYVTIALAQGPEPRHQYGNGGDKAKSEFRPRCRTSRQTDPTIPRR